MSGSGDSEAGLAAGGRRPSGDAVAVWIAYNATAAKHVVQVSSRPAGGAWSDPERGLHRGRGVQHDQDVAIDTQGNATVIWSEIVRPRPRLIVRAASRPSGGDWSDPSTLSESAVNSSPRLAVDPQGTVTAVWLGERHKREFPSRRAVQEPPGRRRVERRAGRAYLRRRNRRAHRVRR